MFNFTKRVLFVGIPDMAYVCLDGLNRAGVNIVGVCGPKKDHQMYFGFKKFALQRNLNFIEYDNLDDASFINEVKDLDADIAVVCSFNYKVPKVLLDSVKGGFINVHPSLLPQYRGPNPYTATILNGEAQSGVTLHYMDETFDTGDIVAQREIPMSEVETMGTLFNRTNILALDMLLEMLNKFETQELERQKQPEGDFNKGKILPEEALYLNYNDSARRNERLIRALNPFVLARTNFRGNQVKILTADVVDENVSYQTTGEIVKIEGDKFYISTSKGLLAPTSMQFGSFFAGTSKEFIKILNPKVGETFS